MLQPLPPDHCPAHPTHDATCAACEAAAEERDAFAAELHDMWLHEEVRE
jgi:hypothetical protein